MKENEVPQDDSPLKKHNSTELVYALNEQDDFVTVKSSGWNAKSDIQYANLEVLQQRIDEAFQDVVHGRKSPIAYYMELHRMDLSTLAAYVNKWPIFVKRHLKPKVFERLSTKTLEKYARVFDVDIATLKNPVQ